eukprot:3905051-Alexandrium_andersonii.AAC.1
MAATAVEPPQRTTSPARLHHMWPHMTAMHRAGARGVGLVTACTAAAYTCTLVTTQAAARWKLQHARAFPLNGEERDAVAAGRRCPALVPPNRAPARKVLAQQGVGALLSDGADWLRPPASEVRLDRGELEAQSAGRPEGAACSGRRGQRAERRATSTGARAPAALGAALGERRSVGAAARVVRGGGAGGTAAAHMAGRVRPPGLEVGLDVCWGEPELCPQG